MSSRWSLRLWAALGGWQLGVSLGGAHGGSSLGQGSDPPWPRETHPGVPTVFPSESCPVPVHQWTSPSIQVSACDSHMLHGAEQGPEQAGGTGASWVSTGPQQTVLAASALGEPGW